MAGSTCQNIVPTATIQNRHTMTPVPEIITAMSGPYDYDACWLFLEKTGKAIYGAKFRLYVEDAEIIAKLFVWALSDQEQAKLRNIDLHKGIALAGPVGCGKTTLMSLLRHILPPARRYQVKSCREIAFEFAVDGFPVISRYSKQSFHPASAIPVAICFDDLGLESTVQYYGNPANTMAEILLSRYDYFVSHQMVTHITTNLNSREIEDRYGKRVRSRMRELFNLIAFGKSALDKR
jgi:hypothetical protein